jgi:hypothetical protein
MTTTACPWHKQEEASSVVTPAIHGTSFCGLSKTVLGGVVCKVLMAVTMHSLVFYIVMCTLVTYVPNSTLHPWKL